MSEAIIFDVGHGNCTLISSEEEYAVIDAPTGSLLLNTLEDLGVSEVKSAFISHADADHVAGVTSLLTSRSINLRTLYLNPDALKRTRAWEELRLAVAYACRSGECRVITTLTPESPGQVRVGRVRVEVEAPSASLILGGAGSVDSKGRTITSNSVSAVLALSENDNRRMLVAGDLDEVGLDDAINENRNLSAATLVFPHHGGLPSASEPRVFTQKLLNAVQPDFVAISHGRSRFNNPHPAIVENIVAKGCSLACTQLSNHCSSEAVADVGHAEGLRALGMKSGHICAGSMTIELSNGATRDAVYHASHQSHVNKKIGMPLCRRRKRPIL